MEALIDRVLKNDLDIPSFREYLAQRTNVGDDPQTMIADLDLDRSTFLSAFVTITKFIDDLKLIRECMKEKVLSTFRKDEVIDGMVISQGNKPKYNYEEDGEYASMKEEFDAKLKQRREDLLKATKDKRGFFVIEETGERVPAISYENHYHPIVKAVK